MNESGATENRATLQARIEAVRNLVQTGGAEAARVLATALAYPDSEFQGQIAASMIAIGEPAVAALKVVVNDANSEVRRVALTILGRISDGQILELLLRHLSDPSPQLRAAAAAALGSRVELDAAGRLNAMALEDPDPACRREAGTALRLIGKQLLKPYLELLGSDDPARRLKARDELATRGSVVVPALTELLDHGNPLIRNSSAETLGTIADPRALEPLIEAMSDPDDDVRLAAAQALSRMKSEKAVRFLIGNLANADDKLATEAAAALVNQGAVAIRPLVELLDSNRRELRSAAIELLGKIRDRRATRPLVALLNAPDSWLRVAVARALGRLGDPDATDALVARLSDPVPMVRAAAAEALGDLNVTRATEALIGALQDEELIVQIAAVKSLGKIGNDLAGEPLIQLLGRSEPLLRIATIGALTDLRDPHAVPALKRIAAPWPFSIEPYEIKAAARRALEMIRLRF